MAPASGLNLERILQPPIDSKQNKNKKRLKVSIQNELTMKHVQIWSKCKQENNFKMFFHSTISTSYILQPSLISSVLEHRKAVCKSRIRAYIGMIDRDRYVRIPREEWLCNVCDELEEQTHFLDKCVKHNRIRSQLLNTIRLELASNVPKPADLFLFSNMQNILAKHVFKCCNARTLTCDRNPTRITKCLMTPWALWQSIVSLLFTRSLLIWQMPTTFFFVVKSVRLKVSQKLTC